jgi:Ser/Thr protein kinase RdoA (MazF antagonist)
MEVNINPAILQAFGLKREDYQTQRFGHGHINDTILLLSKSGKDDFVLQKINTNIFKQPEIITTNHRLAADYLALNHPEYFFITPVRTITGEEYFDHNTECWRLLPYVPHSVALDEATSPTQAYEAARQFGKLTRFLNGIDLHDFRPSIPNFHNLTLRYSSLQDAIRNAREERREYAEELIDAFLEFSFVPIKFEELKTDTDFPDRLLHHDTKINNVLLDEKTFKGICVIDLDTLMPGKIISDLGDMVRTYVSPASEEEQDFSKIEIREDYYEALMKGYLSELGNILTDTERDTLFYAGQFMIYMQGIRFLSDFLNNDIYYPIKYAEHNFNRAKNQLILLERLTEKENVLEKVIRSCFK